MSADLDSLLAPNDDKQFEQLCQHVLEYRFKTLWGQAYGRNGQAQHGVDFYVEVPAASEAGGATIGQIVGVQCKHKDRLHGGELGGKELEYEVKKAKGFKPALTNFILATSAPTDTKLQDKARKLTAKHQKQTLPFFPVEVWFWEKIRAEFSTARELRREILERFYPNLIPVQSAQPSFLHQLPSPPPKFTGRDAELADLEKQLTDAHKSGATISGAHAGLQGMGGVGKTALATVLAHRLQNRYPDAQIYLNLRGADPEHRPPVTPAAAMQKIIHAFHPEMKLPEELDELTPVYLGVLNKAGRALLFLDNAADGDQVKPLLPPVKCLLLVTSRTHFVLPGMVTQAIDCLRPENAQELLLKLAPRIDGYEKDAAELCGHLPLALEVFAGVVASHYIFPVSELVERLRQQPAKLTQTDATFQVSHDLLAEDQRRRWIQLAVFSASFDLAAAAAVWAEQEDSAREAMQSLVNASLVELNKSNGRFRLHDLVRAFCLGKLPVDILDAAHLAHIRHYTKIGAKAGKAYVKGDAVAGLALFDRERVQIEAAYSWLDGREDEVAARQMLALVNSVADIDSLRFHPRQSISWLISQLRAARRLQDRGNEAAALGNLGIAHANLSDARKAIEYHEQALVIARQNGDRRAEVAILVNLGTAHAALGGVSKTVEYLEKALAVSRETGDPRAEGNALCNLGVAHTILGDIPKPIALLEQLLVSAREIRNRRGEGNVLGELGIAYAKLGHFRVAINYFQQQLVVVREIGDRRGEGIAMGNLGCAHRNLDDPLTALGYQEQALVIAREIGNRGGEANALWNAALAHESSSNHAEAIARATAALAIFEAIEDPNAAMVRAKLAEWREQP
jgi:tetratricopeptide (TPR) repeat protein